MKRFFVFAALLILTAVAAHAQDSRDFYNKYSDEDGVSAVYISPSMFKMIGKLPDIETSVDGQKLNLTEVIKTLKGFYLLNTGRADTASRLNAEVKKLLNANDYELMMEAKDSGESMRIYTIGNKDTIHSLVMHVTDKNESTFIGIDGIIDRDKLEMMVGEAMKD